MEKLDLLCEKIFKAAKKAADKENSGSPAAYIHVKISSRLWERRQELKKIFDRLKWDSSISTADLEMSADDSFAENHVLIESIEEFYDDEKGKAAIYEVEASEKEIDL